MSKRWRTDHQLRLRLIGRVLFIAAVLAGPAFAQLTVISTLPDATQGTYYYLDLALLAGWPPLHASLAVGSTLPAGLQLNSYPTSDSTITGTPQGYGTFYFTLQLTDSGNPPQQLTKQYTLTIHQAGNPPLAFLSTVLPDATFAAPYGPQVLVTGGVYPYRCSYTGGGLAGFAFDRNCSLVANPVYQAAGTYQLGVSVWDSSGQQIFQNLTITIDPGIELEPTLLGGGVGTPYSDQTSVLLGGVAPYSFAITSGGLPPGLQFNTQTGAVTGTPTIPGNYLFTVVVTDSKGLTGSQTYTLQVAGLTLTVTPSSMYLPTGRVGVAYTPVTFTIGGGTAPYAITQVDNGLPPGLTMSPAGVVSGTPSVGGTFTFEFLVKDSIGDIGEFAYWITIQDLYPTTLIDGYLGNTYVAQFLGIGFSNEWTLKMISGSLPAGITFQSFAVAPSEANRYYLNGTPTQPGAFTFTVEAQDTTGPPLDRTYTLYISRPIWVISKSHSGSFSPGQNGANYTVAVANTPQAGPTTGMVTVTEAVPTGMTLVSMSGSGWTCPSGGSTCTRSDLLTGGSSYPPITVTVNIASNAAASLINQVSVSGGGGATATASDVTAIVGPPSAVSVTPASGGGMAQTFSFVFSDVAGYQDMAWQQVLISGTGSAACHVFYAGNQVLLIADNGASALGPLTLGTSGTLANSQCTLNAGSSSAVGSGTTLTLNLALTFQASFAGTKSVLAAVASAEGLNSGWQTVGSWITSNPVPTVLSATPASGSGTSQMFSFAFSDTAGYQDLVWQQVLISGSGAAACHLFYAGNQAYLIADDGSSLLGPLTLGTSGTLANSQCTLNAGSSSAVGSGSTLTLNLALTFQPSFAGTKSILAAAASADGLNSGWQTVGSWITSNPVPTVLSVTPASGSGTSQMFSFAFSDTAGYQDLVWQQVLISGSGAGACHMFVAGNQVYLMADNGSSALGPLTLETSGTLANSQCMLNAASSSAVGSGTMMTLHLALTFQPSFAGALSVMASAASAEGLNSGWQMVGSWTTSNPVPAVVSVTPASGSGLSQTFSLVFSDAAGYQDLVWQQVLISGSGSGACHMFASGNQVYLMADNGSSALGPVTLGTSGTLSNSQCTLNAASSSAVGSGTTLTVNLSLTFQPSFSGLDSIFGAAGSADGLNSGWQTVGTWTPD